MLPPQAATESPSAKLFLAAFAPKKGTPLLSPRLLQGVLRGGLIRNRHTSHPIGLTPLFQSSIVDFLAKGKKERAFLDIPREICYLVLHMVQCIEAL
jgi:hypothetical protein